MTPTSDSPDTATNSDLVDFDDAKCRRKLDTGVNVKGILNKIKTYTKSKSKSQPTKKCAKVAAAVESNDYVDIKENGVHHHHHHQHHYQQKEHFELGNMATDISESFDDLTIDARSRGFADALSNISEMDSIVTDLIECKDLLTSDLNEEFSRVEATYADHHLTAVKSDAATNTEAVKNDYENVEALTVRPDRENGTITTVSLYNISSVVNAELKQPITETNDCETLPARKDTAAAEMGYEGLEMRRMSTDKDNATEVENDYIESSNPDSEILGSEPEPDTIYIAKDENVSKSTTDVLTAEPKDVALAETESNESNVVTENLEPRRLSSDTTQYSHYIITNTKAVDELIGSSGERVTDATDNKVISDSALSDDQLSSDVKLSAIIASEPATNDSNIGEIAGDRVVNATEDSEIDAAVIANDSCPTSNEVSSEISDTKPDQVDKSSSDIELKDETIEAADNNVETKSEITTRKELKESTTDIVYNGDVNNNRTVSDIETVTESNDISIPETSDKLTEINHRIINNTDTVTDGNDSVDSSVDSDTSNTDSIVTITEITAPTTDTTIEISTPTTDNTNDIANCTDNNKLNCDDIKSDADMNTLIANDDKNSIVNKDSDTVDGIDNLTENETQSTVIKTVTEMNEKSNDTPTENNETDDIHLPNGIIQSTGKVDTFAEIVKPDALFFENSIEIKSIANNINISTETDISDINDIESANDISAIDNVGTHKDTKMIADSGESTVDIIENQSTTFSDNNTITSTTADTTAATTDSTIDDTHIDATAAISDATIATTTDTTPDTTCIYATLESSLMSSSVTYSEICSRPIIQHRETSTVAPPIGDNHNEVDGDNNADHVVARTTESDTVVITTTDAMTSAMTSAIDAVHATNVRLTSDVITSPEASTATAAADTNTTLSNHYGTNVDECTNIDNIAETNAIVNAGYNVAVESELSKIDDTDSTTAEMNIPTTEANVPTTEASVPTTENIDTFIEDVPTSYIDIVTVRKSSIANDNATETNSSTIGNTLKSKDDKDEPMNNNEGSTNTVNEPICTTSEHIISEDENNTRDSTSTVNELNTSGEGNNMTPIEIIKEVSDSTEVDVVNDNSAINADSAAILSEHIDTSIDDSVPAVNIRDIINEYIQAGTSLIDSTKDNDQITEHNTTNTDDDIHIADNIEISPEINEVITKDIDISPIINEVITKDIEISSVINEVITKDNDISLEMNEDATKNTEISSETNNPPHDSVDETIEEHHNDEPAAGDVATKADLDTKADLEHDLDANLDANLVVEPPTCTTMRYYSLEDAVGTSDTERAVTDVAATKPRSNSLPDQSIADDIVPRPTYEPGSTQLAAEPHSRTEERKPNEEMVGSAAPITQRAYSMERYVSGGNQSDDGVRAATPPAENVYRELEKSDIHSGDHKVEWTRL